MEGLSSLNINEEYQNESDHHSEISISPVPQLRLDQLSSDVLFLIFDGLNVLDIINCRYVCCYFREICDWYMQHRIKSFEITPSLLKNRKYLLNNIFHILRHIGMYVINLRIVYEFAEKNVALSKIVRKFCRNVRHLRLESDFSNSDHIQSLEVPYSPNGLRSLYFHNFNVTDSLIKDYLIPSADTLEAITFNFTNLSGECFQYLPKLKSLSLIDFMATSVITYLYEYAKFNSNLTDLLIDPFDYVECDANELCPYLINLERFRINTVGGLQNCSAFATLPKLQHLELNISRDDSLDMNQFFQMLTPTSALTTLLAPIEDGNPNVNDIIGGITRAKCLSWLELHAFSGATNCVLGALESRLSTKMSLKHFQIKRI